MADAPDAEDPPRGEKVVCPLCRKPVRTIIDGSATDAEGRLHTIRHCQECGLLMETIEEPRDDPQEPALFF